MNRNTPEDLVRELLQSNRNLAQDDWITIHPNGEEGGYRRIEIDKDGTILKGGAMSLLGTNIKDLSKNYANKNKVEGMSVKSVDKYREKEKSLSEALINAGKQRNKEDYSGALNTIKEASPDYLKAKRERKTADYYDTVYQHPEKMNEFDDFKKKTLKMEGEKIESERKESDKLQFKEENERLNKSMEEKRKENPLKNEKMEEAVNSFNAEVTEKLQKLKDAREVFSKIFNKERADVLKKIGPDLDEQKLSDQDLNDLIHRIRRVEYKGSELDRKIQDYKNESVAKFKELTQSKTKNQGRLAHYLRNLTYGDPLGDFAFNTSFGRVPDNMVWPHGASILNTLYNEKRRRERLKDFS